MELYYYLISDGDYEYYEELIVSHEIKYSPEEFKNIYNEVVSGVDYNRSDIDDVVDALVTKGFKKINSFLNVHLNQNGLSNSKSLQIEEDSNVELRVKIKNEKWWSDWDEYEKHKRETEMFE